MRAFEIVFELRGNGKTIYASVAGEMTINHTKKIFCLHIDCVRKEQTKLF